MAEHAVLSSIFCCVEVLDDLWFLQRDAVHSTDYADTRFPFVCPSVHPSVTRQYCVDTATQYITMECE